MNARKISEVESICQLMKNVIHDLVDMALIRVQIRVKLELYFDCGLNAASNNVIHHILLVIAWED